jgi:Domain of unknown function (DUF4279)
VLISIRMYLRGENLDPLCVSKDLDIQPARMHQRGDIRKISDGTTRSEVNGLWVWKKSISGHDSAFDECFDYFWSTFESSALKIKELPNVEDAWVDIHFVKEINKYSSDGSVEFSLNPKQILLLSSFCLPVDFSISFGISDQSSAATDD